MEINELIKAAKQTPVTQKQVDDLKKRLSEETEKPITQEFLNRTYS